MLCADSRGSLWRSAWDPTVIPTAKSSKRRKQELSNWTHKQVHSDRVTAVSEAHELIVTGSYDRTLRLWDRKSLKQVALFTCQAPVLCLEVNPVCPGMGVCGDSLGNVYFLSWTSFPIDG
ncbi:telomerase protein component 1-like [Cetorhinus maximus]